ncbi:hypothetical protein [Embleya sp. NPDC005971]|uniref:hypothetical protein n=1 Tax=unclassified Embleya TaxID=2699296 RepID=UPI0033D5096D
MNTAVKVGAFGAGIVLAFGAAFGVGHAVGPVGSDPAPAHGGHGGAAGPSTGTGAPTGPTGAVPAAAPAAEMPGGLQVAERGYTLVPPAEPLPAGTSTEFRFRVLGPDGQPWTRYDRAHDKDLHLIVARRDLSGFQHVHPVLGADGTWSVPLTFANAGTYRMFADFTPTGDPAGPLTLGADVIVAGAYEPAALPAPTRTATVDGYTVTLTGDLSAAQSGLLTLNVSRDGRPVTDLQPYLGAYGHLVALRQGDLGYLHVHPQGAPGDGKTPAGPGIAFHAQAPSAGNYRLYLDFRHGDTVRTAEFTVAVGAPNTPAAQAATPPAGTPEHGEHGH